MTLKAQALECLKTFLKAPSGTCSQQSVQAATVDVRIKGYSQMLVDAYARLCSNTGTLLECNVSGPMPLKRHIQRWSILSSPHVHKTAWTQFERRQHSQRVLLEHIHPDLVRPYLWYIQQHLPPDVQFDCVIRERLPLEKILDASL